MLGRKHLILSDNVLDDEAMVHISKGLKSTKSTKLAKLNLKRNKIGEKGLKALEDVINRRQRLTLRLNISLEGNPCDVRHFERTVASVRDPCNRRAASKGSNTDSSAAQ